MPSSDPDCFDGEGKYPRVFVEWPDRGCFFTSECEDFQALLLQYVAEWGPPPVVEYRDRYPQAEPLACDGCIYDGDTVCPDRCPSQE